MSGAEFDRRVASSAYHLLAKVSLVEPNWYPFFLLFIQRMRGSIIRSKRRGGRGSPWRVPRRTGISMVGPYGVRNAVVASRYRFETILQKSLGRPRNSRSRVSCMWSAEG